MHADIRAVFDTVLPKLAKKVDIVIGEGFHNKVAHFVTILGKHGYYGYYGYYVVTMVASSLALI